MKKLFYISTLLFLLTACGSKDNNNETTESVTVTADPNFNSTIYDTIPYVSNSNTEVVTTSETTTTNQGSSSGDYNSGKSFGYNLGYIAGQEGAEYNPYLPVGPNVSTYSIEYRQGYAAGYSEGYERGQQTTHQGIYADDDDYSDDGGGYYYYEDDDY